MPVTPDLASSHVALDHLPKSLGVSVRVTGHPPLPSVAVTLARASSGVPADMTADQDAAKAACSVTTRDRLLLRTLWESRGRVSEVALLRLCDIDRAEVALQLTNLNQRGPRRHVKLVSISRDLAGALLAFARYTTGTSLRPGNPVQATSPASRSCASSTGLPSGRRHRARTDGSAPRVWPRLPPQVCRAPAPVGSSADPSPVPSRARMRGHHTGVPSAHQPGPAVNR